MCDQTFVGKGGLCQSLGIATGSFRKYRERGLIPPPDHNVEGTEFWHPSTVRAWKIEHPSIGSRTHHQHNRRKTDSGPEENAA